MITETPPRLQILERITLNDSKAQTLRRSSKAECGIQRLRAIVAQGGSVLSKDQKISVNLYPGAGSAAFSLVVQEIPVAIGYACWNPHISRVSWEVADKMFLELSELNGELDCGYQYREPPDAPWLATILLPSFFRISQKHQREIGMLEPCLTWALWDNERGLT